MTDNRLNLKPGPHWSSLEALQGSDEAMLESVKGGVVASLTTESGAYRLLADDDFQALLGLAQDVNRLATTLNDLVAAAPSGNGLPNQDALQELIALVEDVPELAAQRMHEAFAPEREISDSDSDGVITDPAELRAALDVQGADTR